MSFEVPTPQAIDSILAHLDNGQLIAIVDAAGRLPMVEWARMSAQQRQALRAQNMLAGRAAAAERQQQDQAARAARQVEYRLQAQLAGRAERERREREPLLERKRRELQYR